MLKEESSENHAGTGTCRYGDASQMLNEEVYAQVTYPHEVKKRPILGVWCLWIIDTASRLDFGFERIPHFVQVVQCVLHVHGEDHYAAIESAKLCRSLFALL